MAALENRARILIVDDAPALIRALSRMLRNDYDVIVASGGQEAFALLQARPVDAVLSDLAMKEGTGMQLYEQVKAAMPGMEERIVFMTGDASSPTALAWKASVENAMLEKPIKADELRAALRDVVNRASSGQSTSAENA